jgi:hypothetical protein
LSIEFYETRCLEKLPLNNKTEKKRLGLKQTNNNSNIFFFCEGVGEIRPAMFRFFSLSHSKEKRKVDE